MKSTKSINKKSVERTSLLIIVAFIALFSLRILFLDQDMPPWGITNYTPVDEGSYSILALNAVNYGEINLTNSELPYKGYTPPHVRVNIVGNVVSYLSLQLFGDNYYGLRMAYVFFGALNFIVFSLNLNLFKSKYGTKSKFDKYVVIFAQLYLLFDFIFFISNRVAEPSLVRMLFLQLMIYAFLKLEGKSNLQFLVCSMIGTVSVFGVYITNIFVFMALGLVAIINDYTVSKKIIGKSVLSVFGGFLITLACLEMYYQVIWGTSSIVNFFTAILDFSGSAGYSNSGALHVIFKNIFKFFSANSLLYNLQVLSGMFIALPLLIFNAVKKKDQTLTFLLFLLGSFLLQTMVSEDYIVRKFLIVYSVVIYCIVLALFMKSDFGEMRKSFAVKLGESRANKLETVYFVLIFCGCASVYLIRLFILKDRTTIDFANMDKVLILILGLIPSGFAIWCIYRYFRGFNLYFVNMKSLLLIVTCSGMLLNGVFTTKYVLAHHTYTEKNNMIELGNLANGDYVLGEYENGFTLYNSIKPVLNTYEELKAYMENNNSLFYFDYYDDNDPGMRQFFDKIVFEGSEYTVIPVKEFKREFQTFGLKRSMALYQVVSKRDALAYYKASMDREKAYPDTIEDIYGSISDDFYGDIEANIYGDVNADIYGSIKGNIYGNVNGKIYGTVKGHVFGKINGRIIGNEEKSRGKVK